MVWMIIGGASLLGEVVGTTRLLEINKRAPDD